MFIGMCYGSLQNQKIEKKYLLKTITNFNKLKVIVSGNLDIKTHRLIQKIKAAELQKFSSSIKFCKLAEGEADIYLRLSGIKKWDITAGSMILDARK